MAPKKITPRVSTHSHSKKEGDCCAKMTMLRLVHVYLPLGSENG